MPGVRGVGMRTETYFNSGSIHLRKIGDDRPDLTLHLRSRGAETTAIYWPAKTTDDPVGDPSAYISLRTTTDDGDITTFATLDQAEAMRDALMAALEEHAADDTRAPVRQSA